MMFSTPPLNNTIYARNVGAIGDGISDDSTILQSAIDAVPSGTTITFAKGTYNCHLKLRSTVHLHLESGAVLDWSGAGNPGTISDSNGAVSNVRITGKGKIAGTATVAIYLHFDSELEIEVAEVSGLNGAVFSDSASRLLLRANCTSRYTHFGSGEHTLVGNCPFISITGNSAKLFHRGNVTTLTNGVGVDIHGGFYEGWGRIHSGSGSIQCNTSASKAIYHGDLYADSDAPAYVEEGELTVYGNVTCANTLAFNLEGRGCGACVSTGKLTIYGNVIGAIGAVCGQGELTVYGKVSTTDAAVSYSAQNPHVSTMNTSAWWPDDVATYAPMAVVKITDSGVARIGVVSGSTKKVGTGSLLVQSWN